MRYNRFKPKKLTSQPKTKQKPVADFLANNVYVVAILALLGLFGGYYLLKDKLHEWTSSKEQLWKEKNYITGIILPGRVLDGTENLIISWGNVSRYHISHFQNGKVVKFNTVALPTGETFQDMSFVLKYNRLFVHATMHDFISGQFIGKINEGKWELLSRNITNFKSSDKALEVLDNQGNVVLNIKHTDPNVVTISGYSVYGNMVMVIDDRGIKAFDKNDSISNQECITAIRNLKKLFAY